MLRGGEYLMISSSQQSVINMLACMISGDEQRFDLHHVQLKELHMREQLRLFCRACQQVTSWTGVQPDRRSSPQPRIELPLRVRCELPGFNFTEVTRTLTASRKRASFVSRHALRQGQTIYVVMPYSERDSDVFEQ